MKYDPERDLDEVLRSGAGRRVMARIVRSGLDSPPFCSDPVTMGYNAGMQQIARDLDRWLKAVNLDAWLLMHREIAQAEEDDQETSNAGE
jgi:hypothetical protein